MVIIFYGHIAYYVTRKKREKQIFLNIKTAKQTIRFQLKNYILEF